jgi:hypothetical protein
MSGTEASVAQQHIEHVLQTSLRRVFRARHDNAASLTRALQKTTPYGLDAIAGHERNRLRAGMQCGDALFSTKQTNLRNVE